MTSAMAAVRPWGVSGLALQRHEGVAHLEDVGPAAQLVGERGPQPPDGMLLHVERQRGELRSGVGGVGAGGAEEAEQVGVKAGSHGRKV